MVGSHLDITHRKQIEEALRQREAQLIAAQRIREYILSHDAPRIPVLDVAGQSLESAGRCPRRTGFFATTEAP
jgi:hypothetical protein